MSCLSFPRAARAVFAAAISAVVLSVLPSVAMPLPVVTSPASVMQAAASIPNMAQVAPNFYRGGMPDEKGLEELKASGITTVVSLASEKKYLEPEREAAKRLGLRFVYIPLTIWKKPRQNDIEAFLQVVERKDSEPVFVHCVYGRDRTGTMVAMYRIQHDGWNADRAYTEMMQYGFRRVLVSLSSAVRDFEKRYVAEHPVAVAAHGVVSP